jgi:hypothetical protein
MIIAPVHNHERKRQEKKYECFHETPEDAAEIVMGLTRGT